MSDGPRFNAESFTDSPGPSEAFGATGSGEWGCPASAKLALPLSISKGGFFRMAREQPKNGCTLSYIFVFLNIES
jgi:hypothetical protein